MGENLNNNIPMDLDGIVTAQQLPSAPLFPPSNSCIPLLKETPFSNPNRLIFF
jgi:hypothetical protein